MSKKTMPVDDSPNVRKVANDGNGPQAYIVRVPDGFTVGQQFAVTIQGQKLLVNCPKNVSAGTKVRIVPPVPTAKKTPLDSPNDRQVDSDDDKERPAYIATIPDGVLGGEQFVITIQGQKLLVTCPTNAVAGNKVRIVPPLALSNLARQPQQVLCENTTLQPPLKGDQMQLLEVEIPQGVHPGSRFATIASGTRVVLTCPVNKGPGERISFELPRMQEGEPRSTVAVTRLECDKPMWTQAILVPEMKFQWVRLDVNGNVDTPCTRFDANKSAFVRKLEFRAGSDRALDGTLTLVPPDQAFFHSRIEDPDGQELVTYAEIAETQLKNFEDKTAWFQDKCAMLSLNWEKGYMRINVRREFLLEDSIGAVMSISRKDLRKIWRFNCVGETGIEDGGLFPREWFSLVTSEMFDPDLKMWRGSESNQMCMLINPESKLVRDNYLEYYRFLGRVLGMALFDWQLVVGHMAQYIYKLLLGWPITFKDLEQVDFEYYTALKRLQDIWDAGGDLSLLRLQFSTTHDAVYVEAETDLIEGGSIIDVDNDNFPEYLEAYLKYRILEEVKPQLNALVLGFLDVIPEPLLTVFDYQELELLLCGLPDVDIDDWKKNTVYSGCYDGFGLDHPACQWFWEVVKEFDLEMRLRLLQFALGSFGVPSRGFSMLKDGRGNPRLFTIHGVPVGDCQYPRAPTGCNRIDLPMYETKEELRDKLEQAVIMVPIGVDME